MIVSFFRAGRVRFRGSAATILAVDNAIGDYVRSIWRHDVAGMDRELREQAHILNQNIIDDKDGMPLMTIHDDGRIETDFGADVSKLGYWSRFAAGVRDAEHLEQVT